MIRLFCKKVRKMKFLKSLSILFAFVLVLGGLTLGSVPFDNSSKAQQSNLNPVLVDSSNATEVFNAPWQYSSITLSDDLDFSQITINAVSSNDENKYFRGTLDGDGHTISNITFSNAEGGNSVGLIGYANGATIKDLKITGSVTYNLDANNSSLSIGVLLGQGYNVSISNCEIDITQTIVYDVDAKTSIGLIAGTLGGSTVYNTIVRLSSNSGTPSILDITLSSKYPYNIGGVVGAFSSDNTLERVLFFGNIEVKYPNETAGGALGGLVGFVQGSSSLIYNNIFSGTLSVRATTQSATDSTSALSVGAIIGQISINSPVAIEQLNYCYWTDSNLNAVVGNGEQFENPFVATPTLSAKDSISYSFISTSENFRPGSTPFDFQTVFGSHAGNVVLQQFQTFAFSIDRNFDNIVDSISFTSGDISADSLNNISYDTSITITINLKSQTKGGTEITNVLPYYDLTDIKVNGNSKISSESYEIDVRDNSFIITFNANGYTSGSYSFTFQPKYYRCEYSVARDGDIVPGGVTFSGSSPIETIVQSYSIQSAQTTINAVAQGYYTFSHWELYYQDSNNQWNAVPENTWTGANEIVAPTMQSLPINFGVAPFDQAFKLVAVFSSENGIAVDFSNIDNDRINQITVSGSVYSGSAITVLKTLTNLTVTVTMNEGYNLDNARFMTLIRSLYNENVLEEDVIKSSSVSAEGLNTYTLSIDVAKICDNSQAQSISLSLPTLVTDGGEGDGLLWLWITLPCAVVVLGLAIFLIIYFKKRGQAKSNLQKREREKQKETSYKDFYM